MTSSPLYLDFNTYCRISNVHDERMRAWRTRLNIHLINYLS